jgi:hypothetical protein
MRLPLIEAVTWAKHEPMDTRPDGLLITIGRGVLNRKYRHWV